MPRKYRTIYCTLFFLSGFTGLIYESIWTQYLKLFLGHAAYAQALVLAIFMGGIALGSWVCGRYSLRWSSLLAGYAVVEGVIGLFAFFFHSAFASATQWSYTAVIPRLSSPESITLFKWILSAILILPQAILLGMTFPLMAAGIIRQSPDGPGRSISILYFLNSLGAAGGVLVCGFALIRYWGLPGTIRFAGLLNIGIACVAWVYANGNNQVKAPPPKKAVPAHDREYHLLLAVALLTGTASFMYEIGWIRMLSLVLGSSTHAFELMLCAFILGLAFGGFWIRKRSDRPDAVRMLALVQICMGFCAILSLLLYSQTFGVMQWLMQNLPKTDTGYALFNLTSGALSLCMMFPTTLLAGMTLPLITAVLIGKGQGENSIGMVYAANTLGAILGVFFAVHVGLPVFGVKWLVVAGAGLDVMLGIMLSWSISPFPKRYQNRAVITAVCICAIVVPAAFLTLDRYKMGSGVYRSGMILTENESELVYHKDGKTATASVFRSPTGAVDIRTNGKAEAMIQLNRSLPPAADEYTMVLLAALPLASSSRVETVATIGFGSGLTTATVLLDDRVRSVDTIEIEPVMVEASKKFGPMVERAYSDPRSNVHIDDAKTFFAARKNTYDIIISEPSNPWVSGVADLFSDEFYRLVSGRLADDGVFCQWLHLYELDTNLAVSVLKALLSHFPHVALYIPTDNDLIILAKKSAGIIEPDLAVFQHAEIVRSLKRLQLDSDQEISFRRLGDERIFSDFILASSLPPNSDYYPILDQRAARSRFLMESAPQLAMMVYQPLPLQKLLAPMKRTWKGSEVVRMDNFTPSILAGNAMMLYDYVLTGKLGNQPDDVPSEILRQAAELKRLLAVDCNANSAARIGALYQTIAISMTPFLQPDESARIMDHLENSTCASSFAPQERQWLALIKAVGQGNPRAMTSAADAILSNGHDLPNGPLSYVVAVGMAGHIMQGEQAQSLQLWKDNKMRIYGTKTPSIFYQVLVAMSSGESRDVQSPGSQRKGIP